MIFLFDFFTVLAVEPVAQGVEQIPEDMNWSYSGLFFSDGFFICNPRWFFMGVKH